MSEPPGHDWRPTASRAALEQRASLLARARRFFADRGVLEVDTPVVVNAAVTDVHIHSAAVHFPQAPSAPAPRGAASGAGTAPQPFYLHTSPEYAMKRLLAAGSGDIYQICHVVRGLERGRQHNAEFTLIEWYRIGYSLQRLMGEVEELVRALLDAAAIGLRTERLTYREVFLRHLRLDPFTASEAELASIARSLGYARAAPAEETDLRDELLELLMGASIGPRLGERALTFVHGYPASQAALARLDPRDPRAALRFELYCAGMELANGFQELASAAEQRARFERDNAQRTRLGLPARAPDERLLAALAHGLPECAGVALGFDRLLMLASGASELAQVLAFPIESA